MNLYFDNAAAVPVKPETMARLSELFADMYANQEASGHHASLVQKALESAERSLLASFAGHHAAKYGITWTLSGTEAVNAALLTIRQSFSGGTLLYTDGEHASMLAGIKRMPEQFHKVKIPLNPDGTIVLDALRPYAGQKNVFLYLHFVQPETGAVQDLTAVRRILPHALLCCDAIQGAGKLPFAWGQIMPDLFLISGQKIGCPCGGAVIASRFLLPTLRDLRSIQHAVGRLPVPFAILMAEKFTDLIKDMPSRLSAMKQFRLDFEKALAEKLSGRYRTTLPAGQGSPCILSLILNGYQGAIVTRALSAEGVSAASGSACNAETKEPSPVLTAMGISDKESFSGFRLSFFNVPTEEEYRHFLSVLAEILHKY